MRAQPIPRSGVPFAPGAVEARDLAAPTSSNAAGRFYVAAVVAWTIGGTGQDTAGAAAAGFTSSSSSSSRGGGGEEDCRRGCLRQTASHRRVVHSKDGTRIGRLESRRSLVAGRQMDAPSFGPRPQKDRLDKRIRSVLGWLQGAAESPYQAQAGGQSRAREKGTGGQKGRCVRNEHCPCGFGFCLSSTVHCPVGGPPPNHRLGPGRPATRWAMEARQRPCPLLTGAAS